MIPCTCITKPDAECAAHAPTVAADPALTTHGKLAVIGWARSETPYLHAYDEHGGAVRIAQWEHGQLAGLWSCGSRGPGGSWLTFEAAVDAAYRFHVLREDVDGSKAKAAAYFADKPPVLASHAADEATRIAVENSRLAALVADTRADLLSLRQRLREALGMAELATDADIVAAVTTLNEADDGRDDRILDHALALLDLAAEKNPTLQHIAALLRIATSR